MPKLQIKSGWGVKEKSVAAMRASFAVVGLVMLWVGVDLVGMAWRSASWPMVVGEVARVEVVRQGLSADAGGSMFYPSVVYRYEIDGRDYESSTFRFGSGSRADRSFLSAEDAEAYGRETYRIGQPIQIYVDPADPSRAARERGGLLVSSIPLLLGLGALFTALYARDALALFRKE